MADQSQRKSVPEGWVLYDGECGFCSRWVRFWESTLARQKLIIAQRLRMPLDELLSDIRLLTREGELVSGADVYLQVTKRIWWAWPFYAIFSLPGFNRLIHLGYRLFARNRYCVSHTCKLPAPDRTASAKKS